MKKKILALCLVVVLAVTAVTGVTLAYFTDHDSEKNTFTVGNIDIEVTEDNRINGEPVDENTFDHVMPSDVITKKAVVTNNSDEDAYVRVVVHMDNQEELFKILDAKDEDGNPKYAVEDIFNGWNFTFDQVDGMRYTSNKSSDEDVTVIAVDEAVHSDKGGTVLMSGDNFFATEYERGTLPASGITIEESGRVIVYDDNKWTSAEMDYYTNPGKYNYYQDLVGLNKESAVAWIFYLKMEPKASYILFEGINVLPAFDAEEMAFFKDLEINVCADAIQSTGFDYAEEAFVALNEAHPLSEWNLGARED